MRYELKARRGHTKYSVLNPLIFAVSRHRSDGAVTVSVRPSADELTPRVLPTGAETCSGGAAQQLLPQIP